jgi:hypothetical protein
MPDPVVLLELRMQAWLPFLALSQDARVWYRHLRVAPGPFKQYFPVPAAEAAEVASAIGRITARAIT